jgi:hypothetical protein
MTTILNLGEHRPKLHMLRHHFNSVTDLIHLKSCIAKIMRYFVSVQIAKS